MRRRANETLALASKRSCADRIAGVLSGNYCVSDFGFVFDLYSRLVGVRRLVDLGTQGEEMTSKNSVEVPNMRQRTVLQHLSLADWKMVDRLPVSAGEMTLSRLLHHGWIESRGEKQRTAVRLTPAGLAAMRSPIGKPSAG
jgi:hypothetical protein